MPPPRRALSAEMMLVGADAIEAEPVGQLHLGQSLVDHPMLAPVVPRAWQLKLIEQAEAHDAVL